VDVLGQPHRAEVPPSDFLQQHIAVVLDLARIGWVLTARALVDLALLVRVDTLGLLEVGCGGTHHRAEAGVVLVDLLVELLEFVVEISVAVLGPVDADSFGYLLLDLLTAFLELELVDALGVVLAEQDVFVDFDVFLENFFQIVEVQIDAFFTVHFVFLL